MHWREEWMHRYYSGRANWKDGTTEFHELVAANVPHGARILEVGAGPTNQTSKFLSRLGELHGVDVSDEVLGNTDLRHAHVMMNDRFPCEDVSFDVVVSDYVAEHVTDPRSHLREVERVLKTGGTYLFRTPNVLHYVALFSRLTPHSFHLKVANPLRANEATHHDPWPTVYRMNSPQRVRQLAESAGLSVAQIRMVEKEPSYGKYARPLFLAFMAYERLVNSTEYLSPLRANMFVTLRKDRS